MKKFLIILIVLTSIMNFTLGQDSDFERLVIDTSECVIGSNLNLNINYDWAHMNLPAQKILLELLSGQYKSLGSLDDGDFYYCCPGEWTGLPFRVAIFKIKSRWNTQYSDSIYHLRVINSIPNIVGQYGERIRNWVIKLKYPILNPILDDTVYCGSKVSFSFAALGLDEDSLYSYEVTDSVGNPISYRYNGFMVTLDSLLNDSTLFNKTVMIKGFYDDSIFKYKHSSLEDIAYKSEWGLKISGPKEGDLRYIQRWVTEGDVDKLIFNFWYDVGKKNYYPRINPREAYSMPSKKELKINPISDSAIKVEYISGDSRVVLSFKDQYNEILHYTIPINKQK
jgi:hypothetical protein